MPIYELIFTGLKMKVLLVLLLAMELRVSQADEQRRYLVSKRSVNGPCQEPEPGTPKVGRCTHIAEWNANDCSYPSKPRKLLYTLAFNSTTKSFAVTISWDQPEYGAPLLWGYEVHLNGDCYQIIGNRPGDRRFVFPRKISFSKYIRKYQILISSLPRKGRSYKNRVEKDLKLPDKCTTYARYRLKLPLECYSVKNLMVLEPCADNSSALIKFNSFSEIVFYHYEVLSPCANNPLKLVTEGDFAWVDGSTIIQKRIYKLREGCIYTIVVRMYKIMKHDIEISKTTKTTFQCSGNPLTAIIGSGSITKCCEQGQQFGSRMIDGPLCVEENLDYSAVGRVSKLICKKVFISCCHHASMEQNCKAGVQSAINGFQCKAGKAMGREMKNKCCICCKQGFLAADRGENCDGTKGGEIICMDSFTECCNNARLSLNNTSAPQTSTPVEKLDCSSYGCQQTCAKVSDGKVKCECNKGYKLKADNKSCEDIDECARGFHDCGIKYTCKNTIGSFTCQLAPCIKGYKLVAGRCHDMNECIEKPGICGKGTCYNTYGSFTCGCHSGYQFNSKTSRCEDIDECTRSPGICEAVCVNTVGSYTCACPKGYQSVGDNCEDIDECAEGTAICDAGNMCQNEPGSYICIQRIDIKETPCSNAGYIQNSKGQCVDIDECARGFHDCGTQYTCKNTIGSFTCQLAPCIKGYKLVAGRCHDMNECIEKPGICGKGTCYNTYGSFTCGCHSGYQFNSKTSRCEDIDECTRSPGICEAVCVNTVGSYTCACPKGYQSVGDICEDIDECAEGTAICDAGNMCQNEPGSYICIQRIDIKETPCSNAGYIQNSKGQCVDIDECARGFHDCGTQYTCKNTIGSFTCQLAPCIKGYKLVAGRCHDMNECIEKPGICGKGTCYNTYGSFTCGCHSGYQFNSKTSRCEDIDECARSPGICEAVCVNTVGSYRCACPKGYQSVGDNCEDIDECALARNRCPADTVCFNEYGNFTCINATCPNKYYVQRSSHYCRLFCPGNHGACADMVIQSIKWRTNKFRKSVYPRGYKFTYSLRVSTHLPIQINFSIVSGNERGFFYLQRMSKNSVDLINIRRLNGPSRYTLRLDADVLYRGKVTSKFVYFIYLSVSKYSF